MLARAILFAVVTGSNAVVGAEKVVVDENTYPYQQRSSAGGSFLAKLGVKNKNKHHGKHHKQSQKLSCLNWIFGSKTGESCKCAGDCASRACRCPPNDQKCDKSSGTCTPSSLTNYV